MSITITVSDEVAEHLDKLAVGQTADVDEKLRLLLVAEYRRKLTHFRLTDKQLTQKYGMSFEAFEQKQVTKELGYSWDVESDAIGWETALDGIQTEKKRLFKLIGEQSGEA
jgi:hypothetical protein